MAKIKRTDNTNFYRPKNPFRKQDGALSITNYKRFINNFADRYDWGNSKRHFYYHNRKFKYANVAKINNALYSRCYSFKRNFLIKSEELETHLTTNNKKELIYYTNSQTSKTPLFCIDIDTHSYTTASDINKVKDFLLELHPGCYYEPSTNQKGLHFYILFDFSHMKFIDTEEVNKYIKSYSDLLKLYCNTFYNTKYDDVKATYSNYEYDTICKKFYLNKCGTLCKLPRPTTYSDYINLYNISFTNTDRIICNAKYLCDLFNRMTDCITVNSVKSFDYSYFLDNYNKLFLDNNHTFIESDDDEYINTVFGVDTCSCNNTNTTNTTSSLLTYNPLNSMGVTNTQSIKNKGFNDEDALKRSLSFGATYFRNYYKINSKIPSLNEYRKEYRNHAGTGTETQDSIDRLQHCYDYIRKTFNPDCISKASYNVGDFVDEIKELITKEQIYGFIKSNYPKRKERVSIEDLDVGLGYYYINLLSNKDEKITDTRSFTVPYKGMIDWFKYLYDKNQYNKRCNNHKALMIRDLLIDIGLIKCIDKDYKPSFLKSDRKGVAQRFVLTEKFSRYNEFKEYYSEEFLNFFTNNHITKAS